MTVSTNSKLGKIQVKYPETQQVVTPARVPKVRSAQLTNEKIVLEMMETIALEEAQTVAEMDLKIEF